MKRTTTIRLMNFSPRLTARTLGALVAVALLAAFAPTNVRAGDDGATTKQARQHQSARVRHTRHVHYVSDPRHDATEKAADRVIIQKADDAPLDESLYRSFQERNMINPG